MNDTLREKIIDKIKFHELYFVDYRDSLDDNAEVIQQIVKTGYPEEDLTLYWETDTSYIREEVKRDVFYCHDGDDENVSEDGTRYEDIEDELIDIIFENCSNDPTKDLVRNTAGQPIRATLYSNYDCINSDWLTSQEGYSYRESYFGDMVDTLLLNPKIVQQHLEESGRKTVGEFPDMPARNGLEYVSYKDFIQELANSCGNANNLVFVGMLDLSDVYGKESNGNRIITIPKGNCCGLFDNSYGSGSLIEMELLKDFTFVDGQKWGNSDSDTIDLCLDTKGSNGYSIDEVYGPTNEFYGSKISIS